MTRRSKNVSVREWLAEKSEPDLNSGCLLWTGRLTDMGYGRIGVDGRLEYVHRLSYIEAFGPIPDGLCVCHKCDTPACLNPAHLFLGSHSDNMWDMARKGRANKPKGSRHFNSKLTEADVKIIKTALAEGEQSAALARRFNVSESALWSIKNGHTWRHVSASVQSSAWAFGLTVFFVFTPIIVRALMQGS